MDPATGAGSLTVPIPSPAGRADLGPALSLAYSSRGGNSAFGAGWMLAGATVVSIDTREHLPRWDGADPLCLDGDELVPWLEQQGHAWVPRQRSEGDFAVAVYRPRLRSATHRVERWTHRPTGRVHVRAWDARGVLTVYGARPSAAARIADPADDDRTFAWLPELQIDHSGNAVWFEYAAEALDGIDLGASFERRAPSLAQRYLKRVRYGNSRPLSVTDELLAGTLPEGVRFCFQLVFDYGDHSDPRRADPDQRWPARVDPFTSCRPGFELRTWRLCRRILAFHDFPALGSGPTLVGALELVHDEHPSGSTIREIRRVGYRRDGDSWTSRATPPLRMTYAAAGVGSAFTPAPVETQENIPAGVGARRVAFVDLFGEGLPGVLTEGDHAWYYKSNLGDGQLGPQVLLKERPAGAAGSCGFGDFDRDGDTDYARLAGRFAGAFELDRESERWRSYRTFSAFPHVEAFGSRAQWVDLDGDGRPDLVVGKDDSFTWYPSREDGFEGPIEIPLPPGARAVPTINADVGVDLFFADMIGDGLLDLVRVQNGHIEYWPHLGNGRFGDVVVMGDPPELAGPDQFDPARVRFVDLDGSGTSDLVYLGRGEISIYINAGGNRWLMGPRLAGMPYIDNLSSVSVLDFLGDGRPCLVWSTPLPGRASAMAYLPLTPADPPRLLLSVENSMGLETRLSWSSSATHYLRDQRSGRGWSTRLPQHHPVVDQLVTVDAIGGTRSVHRYEYHDGYYDGPTRELRGFGQVDVYDARALATSEEPAEAFAAPALTRTWFHRGNEMLGRERPMGTYGGDPELTAVPPHVVEDEGAFAPDELHDGLRALSGRIVRRETWATDAHGRPAEHPFEVVQHGWMLRRAQPAHGRARAAFAAVPLETVTATYEQVAADPRVTQRLTVEVDAHDRPTRMAEIAYARRPGRPRDVAAQDRQSVVVTDLAVLDVDEPGRFELGVPVSSLACELVGLRPAAARRLLAADLRSTAVVAALAAPAPHHLDLPDDPAQGPRARLLRWEQSYYWDDARAKALPLGQVGALTMVHHEEAACFAPAFVTDVLGSRVDDARLAALGYVQRDGLWWQADPIHVFAGPDRFSLRTGMTRSDGAASSIEYDDDVLVVRASVDPVGNRVEAEIDYHLLVPWRITDPNGNIGEVRYDPLGVPVVSTTVGHLGGQPWGFAPLSQVPTRTPSTLAEAIADPAELLQGAARYQWYDLDAWSRDGTPPVMLALAREDLVHDGQGGGTANGRIEVAVAYLDGLGRTLQQKTRVDPGPAIQRDASGAVVIDASGRPVLAPAQVRWRASGHVVYDAKQRPGQVYEPFFTPSFAFEGDDVLARFGVATVTRYDAVGRAVGQHLPNGTFTRTSYGPWASELADTNDTVMESTWRIVREGLPADSPEKQALEEAKPHADTTRTVFLDPVGREVATLARGGTTDDRRSEQRLSVDGHVRERIDARGLTAFRYRRDMQGRALFEASIDAGPSRALPDGFGRNALSWSARGFETERVFDAADRLLHVHVRGGDGPTPLDHRILERVYGEQAPGAGDANLRGQVVTVRDSAGEVTAASYAPTGKLRSGSRHLRTVVDSEPDWRAAVPLDDESFPVSATFDALGRVRRETLPDGSICDYVYQAGGPLDRVRITTPDGALNEQAILDGAAYDARGQREQARLGNGVDLAWSYEPETFRLERQTARLGARVLQDLRYTYDPVGNLVRLTDAAQEGPGALIAGAVIPARRDYVYDAHYRLRSATGRVHQSLLPHDWVPGADGTVKGTRHLSFNNGAALERFTRTYDYDAANNLTRLRHVGASHSFTTDFWISATSNRSVTALDLGGNPVQDPESRFDAAGQVRVMDHLRAVEWGWNGTLTRAVTVARPGGTDDDERYVYGADAQRIRKITTRMVQGGQVEVTEKLYFGACERKRIVRNGNVLLERWTAHVSDGSNRVATVHRWTKDDLARETDDLTRPHVRYQLSTHQGSSALELDEHGALISYEEYFPYGGTAFLAGDKLKQVAIKEYRYSAKERDDATSFYYYGYRYYAPWLGRWLSPDPVGPKDDLNLYQFVLGDPVGNVDPAGLGTLHQPGSGRVREVYVPPAKGAPDLATRIRNQRDSLKKVYRAGFDSLSEADKARYTQGKSYLVPRDPTDPVGKRGWTLLTPAQYWKTWLPARQAWAKSVGEDVILIVATPNPAHLRAKKDAGPRAAEPPTDQQTTPPSGKKDPWASDPSTGEVTDASRGDDKNAKDSGDNSGKDKTGGAKDGGKLQGRGQGDGTGTGTTSGDGPGGKGTDPTGSGDELGGIHGGRAGGEIGGTPFSTGHTPGGQGNGADDAGPGVGTGTGGRGDASSGAPSPTGADPAALGADGEASTGAARAQSQGGSAPQGAAGSPSSDRRDDRGDGPGGAGQDGSKSGGHESHAWATFMTVGEIAALQLSNKGGSEQGIPGGFGSGHAGRFLQAVSVCLSILDFISLATGIGELLDGLVGMVRGLFRIGKKLLTELPELLRLGFRALRTVLTHLSPSEIRASLAGLRGLFNGARDFFSIGRASKGTIKTLDEVMEAFEKAKHTPVSRRILEAIKAGDIRLILKDLNKLGTTGEARKIVVNHALHMEDLLNTIVHEGQHALDIADDVIPSLEKPISDVDRLFAELRAFTEQGKFAELNKFVRSGAYQHLGLWPDELAIRIIESYDTLNNISPTDFWEAIDRFIRSN